MTGRFLFHLTNSATSPIAWHQGCIGLDSDSFLREKRNSSLIRLWAILGKEGEMAWVVGFNPASQGAALAECINEARLALGRVTPQKLVFSKTADNHIFEIRDVANRPADLEKELQQLLLNCRGVVRVERNRVVHGVAA